MDSEPRWFKLLFPYVLWPLGNISITASVLLVVFVSVERYLAICRPLQYKPGTLKHFINLSSILSILNDVILCPCASNHLIPMHISGSIFYIILVCVISLAVNIGRFLEFRVSITYEKTNQMDIKFNFTEHHQNMSQTQNNDLKNNFTSQPSIMSSSATSESKDSASLRNR